MPPDYLARLLATTDPAILATWDRHRHAWAAGTDRTLVLAGAEADLGGVPPGAINAWHEAVDRLTGAEEERRAPYLLVAVPTAERALQLGMSLAALEDAVVPGLLAGPDELRREV